MKTINLFGITVLLLALAVFTGCDNKTGNKAKGSEKGKGTEVAQGGDKPPSKDAKDDDHSHGAGPHGGVVFDFGRWHAEFTVDHGKQEATIYILGSDEKTPAPIKATDDKLLLSIKEPQFQVDLLAASQKGDPEGKTSRFVGKHEKFGKEQEFAGILSGGIDGTQYAADFKEEPAKKDKK